MTTIDLSKPVLDLDEKPITGPTLGQALATRLAMSNRGNPVKYMDWALTLHRNQPIVVDDADIVEIIKFVEDNQEMTILGKSQIIRAISEAKDSKGKST